MIQPVQVNPGTLNSGSVIIDVRSPSEFRQGHIPGAHNIPLFSDEERAKVGTLYKHNGQDAALYAGLDFAGKQLRTFVKEARRISGGREIIVHCWRGGMRSAAMAWLFSFSGLEVSVLRGGYKAYRQHALEYLSSNFLLMVIGGPTGSGKTEILKALSDKGEQVLDLESLAHHRGSAFGAMGMEKQPTVEQFVNNLYTHLSRLDTNRIIWIENENMAIGRVFIPVPFFNTMKAAPRIDIDVPFEQRVQRLVREYGSFPKEELEASIRKIWKRLEHPKAALKALEEGNLEKVGEVTLTYYDTAYRKSSSDKIPENVIKAAGKSPEEIAAMLLRLTNKETIIHGNQRTG